MAIRYRIESGGEVFECDSAAEAAALAAEMKRQRAFDAAAAPRPVAPSPAAPSQPRAPKIGNGAKALTPEIELDLLKSLYEAGPEGVLTERLKVLSGGNNRRGVREALHAWAHRVGVWVEGDPPPLDKKRIGSARGWFLSPTAMERARVRLQNDLFSRSDMPQK